MDNLALINGWVSESKKDKERDESKRTAQAIYLNGYQASGSALDATGYIRAMRIQ